MWLPIALGLLAVSVGLGAFAYWGMFTHSGSSRFDEMDGIIPMAAGAVAALSLLLACIALWWWSRTR
jgi:hypothetical protein